MVGVVSTKPDDENLTCRVFAEGGLHVHLIRAYQPRFHGCLTLFYRNCLLYSIFERNPMAAKSLAVFGQEGVGKKTIIGSLIFNVLLLPNVRCANLTTCLVWPRLATA